MFLKLVLFLPTKIFPNPHIRQLSDTPSYFLPPDPYLRDDPLVLPLNLGNIAQAALELIPVDNGQPKQTLHILLRLVEIL